MQIRTFTCKHCHRTVPVNPCLKSIQEYCGDHLCQKARKNSWATHKRATDILFVQRQHQAQKQWYQNKPGNSYYNQYRQCHPDYVRHNREQQHERNHRRRSARQNTARPPEVKTDTPPTPSGGIFQLQILELTNPGTTVNPDFLMVRLSPYTGTGFQRALGGADCKYRRAKFLKISFL